MAVPAGRPVRSPHERTVMTLSGDRIAAGRRMAAEAAGWMERNRPAYEAMRRCVKRMQETGRRGRVRDRVAAFCANAGVDDGARSLTNGRWAAVSRYMALEDPTLVGDPLEFKDSAIDCFGLLPVSWLPASHPSGAESACAFSVVALDGGR